MTSFKSGTEGQQKLATIICRQTLKQYPWGLNANTADKITLRLEAMTSPLFFIKYKAALEDGDVQQCLSQYDEDNYQRRARFAQSRARKS
ncbi:hypothetical protein [Shewanella colwelliana]|uniref:hypothetical protein n=1 Tax=Shewanella colwelliana TaxID=23 RepID=UPI003736D58F